MGKTKLDAPAPDDAAAHLQANGFDAARQVVDVARFILAGDAASADEALLIQGAAAQATREPPSDTVQNPAAE